MQNSFTHNGLPEQLQPLVELALNLRWTWSHSTDVLWKSLNAELWELSQNPLLILNNVSAAQFEKISQDPQFKQTLDNCIAALKTYLEDPGWYGQTYKKHGPGCIAYFSMEFGISEALPIYAGGLGMLAGDHLKTASDLGVPVVGVGLMYFQGYVRQMLSADDWQLEFYPHNDSTNLPIVPVRDRSGSLLRVSVALPGRILTLRVWLAQVGKTPLYLLDSNDLYNSPADQGITSRLYHEDPETRLLQEIVLGIGGWRVLNALGIEPEVCHLNEGHAAFVALERARQFKHENKLSFQQALWATRAGNVFTTHTPVAAAFDQFDKQLIAQYFSLYVQDLDISMEELLALGNKDMGRKDPGRIDIDSADMGQQANENGNTFNMAYLALHGSGHVNGVSKLHGEVSRNLFTPLFPSWPLQEIPVNYITNGVHVPSWDSQWTDELWTDSCGKQRWLGTLEENEQAIAALSDEAIWDCRAKGRTGLVNYARKRLTRQLGQHGASPEVLEQAGHVLDPNALTLGFARRFTAYKRPELLFHDQQRLASLLNNVERPVQLIVAGKTHPQDAEGKRLLQAVVRFSRREEVKQRVVFLEDYDISLAQQLVQGIDVWINTPRRCWEACGTSGMKVLVNGGLNLSELDGWWAEAYSPDVGWAFDMHTFDAAITDAGVDDYQAQELYTLLEQQVIPEFYNRNERGLPAEWVSRIRSSMAKLTCQFSSNRMVREYVEQCYLPAAAAVQHRCAESGKIAVDLLQWQKTIASNWDELHFGSLQIQSEAEQLSFQVQVYLGGMPVEWINVELYAESANGEVVKVNMERQSEIAGAVNGFVFAVTVPADMTTEKIAAENYVPRIVPAHADAYVPLEESHIFWQR